MKVSCPFYRIDDERSCDRAVLYKYRLPEQVKCIPGRWHNQACQQEAKRQEESKDFDHSEFAPSPPDEIEFVLGEEEVQEEIDRLNAKGIKWLITNQRCRLAEGKEVVRDCPHAVNCVDAAEDCIEGNIPEEPMDCFRAIKTYSRWYDGGKSCDMVPNERTSKDRRVNEQPDYYNVLDRRSSRGRRKGD